MRAMKGIASSSVWVAAVSRKPQVLKSIREGLNWYSEDEKQRMRERFPCVACGKTFSPEVNKPGGCGMHTGALVVEEEGAAYGEKAKVLVKIQTQAQREQALKKLQQGDYSFRQFRWTCCNASLFTQGEIPHVHEVDKARIATKFPPYAE